MESAGLVEWVVVGFLVGALARFLMPGRDPIGCLPTIALGIIGAIAGGKLWEELFGRQRGVAWIGSIIVAMILLAIFRNVTYRRKIRYFDR